MKNNKLEYYNLFVCLFMFYVPSTARSFRILQSESNFMMEKEKQYGTFSVK